MGSSMYETDMKYIQKFNGEMWKDEGKTTRNLQSYSKCCDLDLSSESVKHGIMSANY